MELLKMETVVVHGVPQPTLFLELSFENTTRGTITVLITVLLKMETPPRLHF